RERASAGDCRIDTRPTVDGPVTTGRRARRGHSGRRARATPAVRKTQHHRAALVDDADRALRTLEEACKGLAARRSEPGVDVEVEPKLACQGTELPTGKTRFVAVMPRRTTATLRTG